VDRETTETSVKSADNEPITEAPSARAKALRDEIFGSALSLDEAAYVLGLDRTTVAKYLRENTLVGFQIGREWLVPEEELRAFVQRTIAQRRAEAVAPAGRPVQHDGPRQSEGLNLLLGQRRRPNDPVEQFTEPARQVLTLAQREAQELRHPFLGTEHILLALLAVDDPRLVRLFQDLRVEPTALRADVLAALREREVPGVVIVRETGLTGRAKRALRFAMREAQRLQAEAIGPEHVLLGLVGEGDGVAGQVLKNHGVDLETARAAISQRAES
jgi:excisionase family DNA binding protein